MNAPVLVIGRRGQLARELQRLCGETYRAVAAVGRAELDLRSTLEVEAVIDRVSPRLVVNASGYTAVDAAEADSAAAFRLNRDAPGALARACAARDLPFIHLSTDYVFDGRGGAPYREEARRGPLSVYGHSKAAGEDAVADAGGRWCVLRTSWVYGAFGSNFVKTMLELAKTRPSVRVVGDQRGRPTWARELADASLRLGDWLEEGGPGGVLHAAGEGDATWAEFARAVFERSKARGGPAAEVKPVTTAEFGAAAARPADARLDDSQLRRLLGWGPAPWPESLDRCLDELLGGSPPAG